MQRVDPRARTTGLLSSNLVNPSAPNGTHGEAQFIMAIARHPWLLDEHLEEIASLHLDDAGCCRIRNAMLTIHQTEETLDNEKLLERLSREGYGAELERLERACAHNADTHFASGANKEQVLEGWRHVMMLHGKAGVSRSLLEAESDWLSEQTSDNESRLLIIKQQVEIAAS
jgi:DNA primase